MVTPGPASGYAWCSHAAVWESAVPQGLHSTLLCSLRGCGAAEPDLHVDKETGQGTQPFSVC